MCIYCIQIWIWSCGLEFGLLGIDNANVYWFITCIYICIFVLLLRFCDFHSLTQNDLYKVRVAKRSSEMLACTLNVSIYWDTFGKQGRMAWPSAHVREDVAYKHIHIYILESPEVCTLPQTKRYLWTIHAVSCNLLFAQVMAWEWKEAKTKPRKWTHSQEPWFIHIKWVLKTVANSIIHNDECQQRQQKGCIKFINRLNYTPVLMAI